MGNVLKFPICMIKGHVLDSPSIINFMHKRNYLKKCSRCGLYHAYSDSGMLSITMTKHGAMKMKRDFEKKISIFKNGW